MTHMLRNLSRITYLELVFSLRIPVSLVFNFLAPSMMLLLLGSRLNAQHFIIPGLIALFAATSTIQGVGQVANSMRYGIWKTLRVSLHPAWLYLLGLLISRILRSILVTLFLLLLAFIAFDYRLDGSFLLHTAYLFLGSCAFASIGLLLAYLPKSAMSGGTLINLCVLCMTIVSGTFITPTGVLKLLSYASPLTFVTDLVRANALGQPLPTTTILLDIAILVAWVVGGSACAYWLANNREED